ncbi:acetoin utilization protein AcuC [Shimia ponticola]|uniref:acetoin utilization protein AcuC n=1 Tax=Shimia ponticola TaxID=2582893 RepID=UPI0011BE5D2A|nr:acetoin utilization protein AcuC [Shimia ponticola]
MTPLFFGSEIYRGSSYGHWHPLRVPRVSTTMDLCRAMGWLPRSQFQTSPRAKPSALSAWHDPDYLSALVEAEETQSLSEAARKRFHIGTPSNPIFPEVYRRPATGAGASLAAGELLRNPGIIYHPGGGTHHGMPARANGFCYLNDCVLAIQSLRRSGLTRIAYIDIDAHHPDGVVHAYGNDPDTLLISVHEAGRWPRTGALTDHGMGTQVNLPVPAGLNDTEFEALRDAVILPWVQAFRPEAIVLQCGADAVTEDPQSRLALSNNAHWSMVRAVMALTDRLLVLGGGGYNPWSVGRLWSGVWATLNGYEIPETLPEAGQCVLRDLTWERGPSLRPFDPPPDWTNTLRDPARPGPMRDATRAVMAHHAARRLALT